MKEKQKQHLIDIMKADEELGLYEEETKCYCGHTTYCDCIPLEVKIDILDFNQIVKELKQETLEEVAERYEPKLNKWTIQEIFKDGAKWQQEQNKELYSEEEVKNLLNKRLLSVGIVSSEEATNIWFKQYTKTI